MKWFISALAAISFMLPSACASKPGERLILIDNEGRDGVRRNTPLDDGGFILSGWTQGNVDRKDGAAWVLRVDSEGKIVWKNIHPNGLQNDRGAHSGAHFLDDQDETIVYTHEEFRSKDAAPPGLTGRSTLYRATIDGEILNSKLMGGAGTDIIDIMVPLGDGSIAMAGETTSPEGKSYDGWLFVVDRDFNIIWDKKYGGLGYERFNGMIHTSDGGYAAIGRTSGAQGRYRGKIWKMDEAGNVIWAKRYREDKYYASSLREIVEMPNGEGYIFAGWIINNKTENPRDVWIGRLTQGGSLMWDMTLGGAGDDIAFGVIRTGDGNYLVGGQTQDSIEAPSDALSVAFDKNGNVLWKKRHGVDNDMDDVIRGIIPYKDNGYILTGNAENKTTGQHDALMIIVDDVSAMN